MKEGGGEEEGEGGGGEWGGGWERREWGMYMRRHIKHDFENFIEPSSTSFVVKEDYIIASDFL